MTKSITHQYIERIQYFFDHYEIKGSIEVTYEGFKKILVEMCSLSKEQRGEICYFPGLKFKFKDAPISLIDLLTKEYYAFRTGKCFPILSSSSYYAQPLWQHQTTLQLLNAGLTVTDELALEIMEKCCIRFGVNGKDLLDMLHALHQSGKNIYQKTLFESIQQIFTDHIELSGEWVEEEMALTSDDCQKVKDQHKKEQADYSKGMLYLCCLREFQPQSLVCQNNLPKDMFNLIFKP